MRGVIAGILIIVVAAALFLSAHSIIESAAKWQLKKVFPGCSVSIKSSLFDPAHSIVLSDVEIKRPGAYGAKIKEIRISYSLPSMLRRVILAVSINDPIINIDLGRNPAAVLKDMVNPPKGGGIFRIREESVSGLRLELKSRDVYCQASLSIGVWAQERRIRNIDIKIDRLQAQGVTVEEGRISSVASGQAAELSVGKIGYKDAAISDIRGVVRIDGGEVLINQAAARLFEGDISGAIGIACGGENDISVTLACSRLDLGACVRDLKLGEKIEMTGTLSGVMSLAARGFHIIDIRGDFSTDAPGGTLVIKDTRFLENIAKASKQPLDLIIESFKYYKYTGGVIKVSLDGGDLILDVALDGEAGKRNFTAVMHGFIPGKGRAI